MVFTVLIMRTENACWTNFAPNRDSKSFNNNDDDDDNDSDDDDDDDSVRLTYS